jgi:colicin import membrane protein
MSTATAEPEVADAPEVGTPLVRYSPTDAQIAQWAEQFRNLPARVTSPDGYEEARLARATTRKARVAIEAKRKELKADSLAWGRKVDAEAGRLTDALFAIEEPITAAMKAIDDEKERKRREAEEAEKAKIAAAEKAKRDAEEGERKAAFEAQQAALRKQQEELAEQKRILDEQRAADEKLARERQAKIDEQNRAERERLDKLRREEDERRMAERRRLDAEDAALRLAQRKEQDRLDADRRKLQAEKDAVERDRLAKIAAEKAEADARERVRLEQEAAERARVAKEAEDAAEAARLEALRPDAERLHRWADQIAALHPPEVQSAEALEAALTAHNRLTYTAQQLKAFGVK